MPKGYKIKFVQTIDFMIVVRRKGMLHRVDGCRLNNRKRWTGSLFAGLRLANTSQIEFCHGENLPGNLFAYPGTKSVTLGSL